MDADDMGDALQRVLIEEHEIRARITELAAEVDADYAGRELLVVGVLKGAVMVMADLARALHVPTQMDWMAVSSYGSGTKSSGVVRILKDLDGDITGRHVLIVEDIIDSGLTLSWRVAGRGIGRGLRAPAQAGGGPGRCFRSLHRLQHPERIRCGLRPGLRRALSQPAFRRDAGTARLYLTRTCPGPDLAGSPAPRGNAVGRCAVRTHVGDLGPAGVP